MSCSAKGSERQIFLVASASLGSLKGPKHGGANIKVVEMMQYLKRAVRDWTDDGQIKDQLVRILNRELGDGTGLIYGMGHAVYTLSDPRAEILKQFSRHLAEQKGIPAQRDVLQMGGTEAGPIQKTRAGVYAGGISIPCRYTHTPAELADLGDVRACAQLVAAFAECRLEA